MIAETVARVRARLPWVLLMTIVGGLVFVWVQVLTNTKDIATFIGGRIVEAGDYPATYAAPIGWTTHFAISFIYALAFAVISCLPVLPKKNPQLWVVGLVLAIATGWVTTWIADPAISFTIALLAGRGWPDEIYPLHLKIDVPLFNHLLYFVLALLLVGCLPEWLKSVDETKAGRSAS